VAEVAITAAKSLFIVLLVVQVMGLGVFFERKVSALIQDRIGREPRPPSWASRAWGS